MHSKSSSSPRRPHQRAQDALRPVRLETGAMKFAEGSAKIEVGDTHLLISATVDAHVPKFLIDSGKGWVTAEYSMLPRSTQSRFPREVNRGRQGGRTLEIQRLIGRSLRAAVDLKALGEWTVTLDCDVVQADGGTRTAAITGAYVALVDGLAKSFLAGDLKTWPIIRQVAAVSVGFVHGAPLLDLEYCEDSIAEVDMNVVATVDGEVIEVQGTGEQRSFTRAELDQLLDLAFQGISELAEAQNRALAPILAEVDEVLSKGRQKTAPKDEKSLWGPPS